MSKPEEKLISIDDLDSASANEIPFEMPVLNQKGIDTGARILVIGSESQAYKDYVSAHFKKMGKAEADAKKRGKEVEKPSFDALIDDDATLASLITVGWKGFKEPFSKENAKRLYVSNSKLRNEVIEASKDDGNFLLKV